MEWTDLAKDPTTVASTEYPLTVDNDSGHGSFVIIVFGVRLPHDGEGDPLRVVPGFLHAVLKWIGGWPVAALVFWVRSAIGLM